MNICRLIKFLPYLPQSIWFNFHYLPFSQAMKLPILLYKPHFKALKGRISISGGVKTGMICLGYPYVSIYPNTGISWECKGNVVFNGVCRIGGNSYFSIGDKAHVTLGNGTVASASLKLVSYHKIFMNENVRIGWNCLFCDTDMHTMTKEDGSHTRGYAPIIIGKYNWIGNNCIIMKRTATPDYTTISAGSLINKSYMDIPEKSILSNRAPLEIVRTGFWRNPYEDTINY